MERAQRHPVFSSLRGPTCGEEINSATALVFPSFSPSPAAEQEGMESLGGRERRSRRSEIEEDGKIKRAQGKEERGRGDVKEDMSE